MKKLRMNRRMTADYGRDRHFWSDKISSTFSVRAICIHTSKSRMLIAVLQRMWRLDRRVEVAFARDWAHISAKRLDFRLLEWDGYTEIAVLKKLHLDDRTKTTEMRRTETFGLGLIEQTKKKAKRKRTKKVTRCRVRLIESWSTLSGLKIWLSIESWFSQALEQLVASFDFWNLKSRMSRSETQRRLNVVESMIGRQQIYLHKIICNRSESCNVFT